MCNRYQVRKSADEVRAFFGVRPPTDATLEPNFAEVVHPGYSGLVITEAEGARQLRAMTWGFPLRLKFMKPDSKPKPVNNIADLNKGMWKGLAAKPQWRCLIPLTEFAEAEGPKGAMTETWISVKDQELFAWGGLWRYSDEWGPVYSGAMTACNEAIRPVHDRMPILLHQVEWDRWLNGSFEDLLAFQSRCFPDELIEIRRTEERWTKPRATAA